MQESNLVITVWDKDFFLKDKFIGMVFLSALVHVLIFSSGNHFDGGSYDHVKNGSSFCFTADATRQSKADTR